MAAYLKFPTEEEWEVLRRFLNNEGCIIIPPPEAIYLSNVLGSTWTDFTERHRDRLMEYDFAGDADVWVDIASKDSYALNCVENFLAETPED